MEVLKFTFHGAPIWPAEGSALRAGSPLRGRGVPQCPRCGCWLGTGASSLEHPSSRQQQRSPAQPPAGPALDVSAPPGQAQRRPGKGREDAQDAQGWAARGRHLPAASPAPRRHARHGQTLRSDCPEHWTRSRGPRRERRTSWDEGVMPACRQGVVRDSSSARGERRGWSGGRSGGCTHHPSLGANGIFHVNRGLPTGKPPNAALQLAPVLPALAVLSPRAPRPPRHRAYHPRPGAALEPCPPRAPRQQPRHRLVRTDRGWRKGKPAGERLKNYKCERKSRDGTESSLKAG